MTAPAPTVLVKHTIMRLTGLRADNTLMYPGQSVLTWVRAPGMPWIPVSIELWSEAVP